MADLRKYVDDERYFPRLWITRGPDAHGGRNWRVYVILPNGDKRSCGNKSLYQGLMWCLFDRLPRG